MNAWHQEPVEDGARARMAQQRKRDHEKARKQESEHRPLPAAEVAAQRDRDQDDCRQRDDEVPVEAEVFRGQRDAHELGADRQEVQKEEVADRVPAPVTPEALGDEPRVTNSGHGTQAHHHLLVDDEDGDQEHERPQQRVAEILTGLRVGGNAAGVVVADHHDEAGADNGGEGQEATAPGAPRRHIAGADRPESAMDVPCARFVDYR